MEHARVMLSPSLTFNLENIDASAGQDNNKKERNEKRENERQTNRRDREKRNKEKTEEDIDTENQLVGLTDR